MIDTYYASQLHLKVADSIVILKERKIVAEETYNELNSELYELMTELA